MANAIYDIPVENMSNPGGYVKAVKQCPYCNRLIHWSHKPGNPHDLEPVDVCRKCLDA